MPREHRIRKRISKAVDRTENALGIRQRFRFDGRDYRYFRHKYNRTWRNERAIEVPIVWDLVRGRDPGRVLEIGNVLAHYFPVTHDVVDKFEQAANVRNVDVVDYAPERDYDLIVSISTIEHVGFDEPERERRKARRAVENLKRCLAPGGRLLITVPVGYNPGLDEMLGADDLGFSHTRFLRRPAFANKWREVPWRAVEDVRYRGEGLQSALALAVCRYDAPAASSGASA